MKYIVFILIPLSGCWSGSDPVAQMSVEVNGDVNQYFSYLPPKRDSKNRSSNRRPRPTCGWRGGREASVKPNKIRISYDVIHIGCGFDVSENIRNNSKYGLSLEFRKYDGEPFKAVLVIVRTSKDGLILNSNLMNGEKLNKRCKEKNCGMKFKKLDLPNPKDRSDIMVFDFELSAPMTHNLSDKTVHVANFHISGKISRYYPN